jgi:methionyl-tRNA formyltransferase
LVATGGGLLVIERLQPAGKRMMTAGEFLLGYRMAAGERLGPETVAGG